jgi:hypothetical protein
MWPPITWHNLRELRIGTNISALEISKSKTDLSAEPVWSVAAFTQPTFTTGKSKQQHRVLT